MAKLSDLVQVVANVTGEAPASVAVIARSLREAGLIATGGRGRSAARMTSHDLASLLLAVSSLGDNTKAGDTVTAVSQLSLESRAQNPAGLNLTDEHRQALGVTAEQSLLECLAIQIDRYSIESGSFSAGPDMLIGRILPDPASFSFRGSTLPKSIGIAVGRSFDDWYASVRMQLVGGDSITLRFSSSRQSDQPASPTNGRKKLSRNWLIELPPEIVHQAALCLRDQVSAKVA
jgi:hypothetical protein